MRTVRRGSLIFYQLFTLNNHSLVLCIPTDGETIIRLNISQVADADIIFVIMYDAGELCFLAVHHGRDGGELGGYQLQLCRVFDIWQLTVLLPGAAGSCRWQRRRSGRRSTGRYWPTWENTHLH